MESRVDIKNSLIKSVMLGSFSFGLMSFVLPIYSKSIGGKALAIGGLFSIFSLVTLILRPVIGREIDKYGRRRFFVSAFLFYAIAMLLFSYSTSIMMLYIGRFFQAIGSSLMWISAYSIMIDIAENEKRGKAMGQVDGASSKGALYGAFIGFFILSSFKFMTGWRLLFMIYAVLSILGGFVAYRYIPETLSAHKQENEAAALESYSTIIKLLTIVFISSISASMLCPVLMIYLQDKFTTDVRLLSIAFIPAALVYAYLPSKLGGVSDRIGRIAPIVMGLIGSGIVSLAFPLSSSIMMLAALWILQSIGIVMASPAEEALVADIAGKNSRGTAYGLYLFASSLGASIGPLLGGWMYDFYGKAVPFYFNGFILLIDAILAVILFRNYRKSQ